MKKIFKLFLVISLTFMFNFSVFAKEIDHFKGEVNENAEIKDDIKGSTIVAGNNASMKGKADGVSFIIGNVTSFTGESEYLASAGNSVLVKGVINKDAFIAGNIIDIDKKADLKRDVIVAGADVTISGKIGRNISIYASNIKFDGALITGNVKLYATSIEIDKDTSIGGNLSYPKDANIDMNDDTVLGKVIKTDSISNEDEGFMNVLMGKFWSFMSLILVFAILSLVASKLFIRVQKEYDKFDLNRGLETFTKGLMFLIFVPIIIFVLFMMSIGIPLSLILLALYFIIMYLSTMFTGYLLGYKLWQRFFNKDINMLVIGIFGLAILFICSLIPGISFIVSALSTVVGIGIIYDVILKKIGSND